MKVLDIALNDFRRSFRSIVGLIMMFGLPLLITGLFFLALGNATTGYNLPATKVQVVNLDQPGQAGFAAGQSLVSFLQSESLSKIVQVTVATSESNARSAVDRQQADLAVIIPSDFTSTIVAPGADVSSTLTFYQDPTLQLRPSIVKGIVAQYLDAFSGSRIAAAITAEQISKQGVTPDMAALQAVALNYANWAQNVNQDQAVISLEQPAAKPTTNGSSVSVIGQVMVGMMLFFVFITGAISAESIIKEDEEGNLARLFTTPARRSTILGGKFAGIFVTLLVQLLVLIAISALIFSIFWGNPLTIGLMIIGTVVAAAGLGVLLMSFIKNTRQSGPILGGVMAVLGMAGGLLTIGFTNLPTLFNLVNLSTPQGWALRGWKLAMGGSGVGEVLLPGLVLLAMGAVFFTAGAFIFRKRFA